MGILAILIIPSLVSGATSGTAIVTGNVLLSPVAEFSANGTTGTAPFVVQFTDLSVNNPVFWQWDFGDGTNSTEQNPTHTYAIGTYTINLTVSNAAGSFVRTANNYITALQVSPTAAQPPSPPAYGGGSGVYSPGSVFVQQRPLQPAPQSPPVSSGEQNPQRAPDQNRLVSWTYDLSPYIRFISQDPSGRLTVEFERAQAELSGATISVSGPTMEIIRQGFTLRITADSMSEVEGVIRSGTIQSIQLATTSMETYIEGIGSVTSSFTTGLRSLPPNAAISVVIGEPVTPRMAEQFRLAVAGEGDELLAIAYTITVQKTNIGTTFPATIMMSAPAEWVNAHGGINSIVIGRIGDDQKATILKTSFSGYDRNGNMEFVADSPDGLAVFGLIATKGPLRLRMEQSGSMIPGTIGGWGVLILVSLIVIVITGSIIWRKRRGEIKRTGQQEKKG